MKKDKDRYGNPVPPSVDDEYIVEYIDHEGDEAAFGGRAGDLSSRPRALVLSEEEPREDLPAQPANEVGELKNQLIRQRADYENFRRRVERDKAAYRRKAKGEIIAEILPVLDNMDRALDVIYEQAQTEWYEGLVLVRRQLGEVLERLGVKEIKTVGRPFDPALHEAIAVVDDPGLPPNTVSLEHEKGYTLDGRVIRAARVTVSRVPKGSECVKGDGGA